MSLTMKAASAAREKRTAAEQERHRMNTEQADRIADNLATKVLPEGFPAPVFIDWVTWEYAVSTGSGFNQRTRRESKLLYRFRVDDIILALATSGGGVYLERTCTKCGRTTYLRGSFYSRSEERFLTALGEVLAKPAVCPDCALNIPASCPTCGRSNT